MSSPQQSHAQALKCFLIYLKGTKPYRLLYSGNNWPNEDISFNIYTDADFAYETTRKSISGYAQCIGNTPVSWFSRKQSVVALSTTEAQYISATQGAQHTRWLRHLLQWVLYRVPVPTDHYMENRSAMITAQNQAPTKRRKYTDLRHHYLQHHIAARSIALHRIPTQELKADILKEPLHSDAFEKLRDALKIQPPPTPKMRYITGDC